MRADLKDKFRTESKLKFVIAAVLVLGIIATLIFAPRGKEFNMTSEQEVKTAMQICENSRTWVKTNRSKLKLGKQSKLGHITVNNEIPDLKYVKTPQVIFVSSGFNSPNMTNDMFCEVVNPATKKKLYYDYEKKEWRNKIRFRR